MPSVLRSSNLRAQLLRLAVCFTFVFVFISSHATAQSQGLQRSGRWFTYDGVPIYLVGYDRQEFFTDPLLDYEKALDVYVKYRINKVRVWMYNWWGGPALLAPWSYDSNLGKYNLDQWNPGYWQRLTNFLKAAQARNIIVELCLFADYSYHADRWVDPSYRYAWNASYNVNGAFWTDAHGGFFPEFFDVNYMERSTSGKTVRDYQQAFVDKTLQEVGSFPNIYFEIDNEFPGDSDPLGLIDRVYGWQQYWAQYLKQRTARPVNVHAQESSGAQTYGVQYFSDEPYIDSLGFHFYTWDPWKISSLLHPLQAKGKVLTNNESFRIGNASPGLSYYDFNNGESRFAWAMFTSGGYIGHENYGSVDHTMDGAYNRFMSTDEWAEGAQRIRVLRDIAESVRFWELSPTDANNNEYDALVKHGPTDENWQVLCKPGSEYIIYFWGEAHYDDAVTLELPIGDYAYIWYDVRNENVVGTGVINSTAIGVIPPPLSKSWDAAAGVTLVIKRAGPLELTLALDGTEPCVGSQWRLRVTNAAPDQSVTLNGISNGLAWQVPAWHIADASGSVAEAGTFDPATIGVHTLNVVAGNLKSDDVSFKVSNCVP
jgi:hypothetical protein